MDLRSSFDKFFSSFTQLWIEYNFVFARETSLIKPTLDMYAAAGKYSNVLLCVF